MAKINVFVKKDYKDKAGLCPVIVEYNHLDSSFRINPKIKIPIDMIDILFDEDTDLFKLRSIKKLDLFKKEVLVRNNDSLLEIQHQLNLIVVEHKTKNEGLTASLILSKFYSRIKKNQLLVQSMPDNVLESFGQFIKTKESKIGAGINSYRSTYQHLKDLDGADALTFSQLRKEFFEQFLSYLEKKELIGSTIHKQFKNIKIFINWVKSKDEDNKISIPNSYKNFKVTSRYSSPIGLTVQQFKEFQELELSTRTELERTRDLFVFGVAMGGLRHGDLKTLGETIRKHGHDLGPLTFFENKTGNEHSEIPLNRLAIKILNKYPKFPYVPSNQRMNKNLKAIAKILCWDQSKILPKYNSQGKIVDRKYVTLKTIFSTKFMRKTSATIDGMLNIEPLVSMKRSGHKSLSSYMRYREVNKENYEMANSLWNKTFS